MPTYTITAPNGRTYSIEGPDGATQQDVIREVVNQHPEAAIPAGKMRIYSLKAPDGHIYDLEAPEGVSEEQLSATLYHLKPEAALAPVKPIPQLAANSALNTHTSAPSQQGNTLGGGQKALSPEIGGFITATVALIISIVLIAIFYKRISRNLNSTLQKTFFYIILIILGNGLVRIFNELLGLPILGLPIRINEIFKPALTLLIIPIYLFMVWVYNLRTSVDRDGSRYIPFGDSSKPIPSRNEVDSTHAIKFDLFLKICVGALVVIWFINSKNMPKFNFTEVTSVTQDLFKEKNKFKNPESCFEYVLKTAITEEKRRVGVNACQLSFGDINPPTSNTYYGYCIMNNFHRILDDVSGTAVASECAKETNNVELGSFFAQEFNSALRLEKILEKNREDQQTRDLEQAALIRDLERKDRQRRLEAEEQAAKLERLERIEGVRDFDQLFNAPNKIKVCRDYSGIKVCN